MNFEVGQKYKCQITFYSNHTLSMNRIIEITDVNKNYIDLIDNENNTYFFKYNKNQHWWNLYYNTLIDTKYCTQISNLELINHN